MWSNEFHFSRQSLLAISYPIFLYIAYKNIRKREKSTAILNVIMIPWKTISHPATAFIVCSTLLTFFFVSSIYISLYDRKQKIMIPNQIFFICTLLVVWFAWHVQFFWESSGAVETLIKMGMKVYNSLLIPEEIISSEYEIRTYTQLYQWVVDIRIWITFCLVIMSILLSVLYIVKMIKEDKKELKFLYQFLISCSIINLAITGFFLLSGHVSTRGIVLLSASWSLQLIFMFNYMKNRYLLSKRNIYRYIRIFCSFVLVLFLIFSVPILKYSPAPFLSPSTIELSILSFAQQYSYPSSVYLVTEFNVPHSLIINVSLNEFDPDKFIDLNKLLKMKRSFIICGRLILRDGFYTYSKTNISSYQELLDNLISQLSYSSNLIYYSNYYYRCYH
jgi:hypothetical protein